MTCDDSKSRVQVVRTEHRGGPVSSPLSEAGGVSERWLLHISEGFGFDVRHITIEADQASPSHSHIATQGNLVLAGKCTLLVDGESYELFPGDSCFIPSRVGHQFLNHDPGVEVQMISMRGASTPVG